ncbi:MAG: class I SAM-dependent methyltransferase [Spirochaetales bacterium]|nr:class I SAM-dependent methyltransferase [Spirochaetales bacterium]
MNINKLNPAYRFTGISDVYNRFRPGYPKEIIDVLKENYHLSSSSIVADIGSGTGKLSGLFLHNGNNVYCVEPNDEMRNVAEECFSMNPNFISINGCAEKTDLPGKSIDFIVIGQAFHWFHKHETKKELLRIIRENGVIALIWNKRDNKNRFMNEYNDIIKKNCPEYKKIGYNLNNKKEIMNFFKPDKVHFHVFKNMQVLKIDELTGRARSSSYFPGEDSKYYKTAINELEKLFHRYENNKRIEFLYNSFMYVSRIHYL